VSDLDAFDRCSRLENGKMELVDPNDVVTKKGAPVLEWVDGECRVDPLRPRPTKVWRIASAAARANEHFG